VVDAAMNDIGKLPAAVEEARRVLTAAGFPADMKMRVRADAGYWVRETLVYAEQNRDWVDILFPEAKKTAKDREEKFFGRERFKILEDGIECPAGKRMRGPLRDKTWERYRGVGCPECPLRPECTDAQTRTFAIDREYERVANAMRERMSRPDARGYYLERIATIEPVFSNIESAMGYRRVTARQPATIRAEIMLKVLSHNVSRLIAGGTCHSFLLVVCFPKMADPGRQITKAHGM